MKKLLALLLLSPAMLLAQSPFDGTWMTKLDTAQFPKKPNSYLLIWSELSICLFPWDVGVDVGFVSCLLSKASG